MKPIDQVIKYNVTAEENAREWAGVDRRKPITVADLPKLTVKRDRFALVAVAVFVIVATVAALVTF